MDTVKMIFAQLGVDSSLLPQLIAVFVVFLVAKFLFLNHLQFVLENREEKTVKLESAADNTLDKVNRLAQDYKLKIDNANKEAMKQLTSKKNEIQGFHNENFKKTEREVGTFVEDSRLSFEKELGASRGKVFGEVDGLADDLIKKILN